MDSIVDHVLAGLALMMGTIAVWLSRKRTTTSRAGELSTIISLAFDAGIAHSKRPGNAVPLKELVFHAAVLFDVKRDGKRDFDDRTLRIAVDAEGHKRGLW